jgi:hypothetical protein
MAVGFYDNKLFDGVPLSYRWNGAKWSLVPAPEPPHQTARTYPQGVSCVSATLCFGVGYYYGGPAGTSTFAMKWNGTTWTVVPSPNALPPGSKVLLGSLLLDVACTSATSCVAGGGFLHLGVFIMLIEHWNGKSWTVAQQANPPGATTSEIDAVSCSNTLSCYGVGTVTVQGSTNHHALVERWNGKTWSRVPSPSIAGATWADLDGVSCLTTATCVAVGASVAGAQTNTLVEQPSPTTSAGWVIAKSANVAGDKTSFLAGTSCLQTTCFGVGYSSVSGGGQYSALVERP